MAIDSDPYGRPAGRPNRRSIRLPGYDYGRVGAYFITLVTAGRECLFGDITGGEMRLSPAGTIVSREWQRSAEIRREIELDVYVVMPNHVHGIVWITDQSAIDGMIGGTVGPTGSTAETVDSADAVGATGAGEHPDVVGATGRSALRALPPYGRSSLPGTPGPRPRSLGAFVAGFKASATHAINEARKEPGAPVWQRNYFEHVIRDSKSLDRIRSYIAENPLRWADDHDNPLATPRAGSRAWFL